VSRWRLDAAAVLAVLAVAAVAFGGHLGDGGLYFDDWTTLAIQRYGEEPGFLGAVEAYMSTDGILTRPGLSVLMSVANLALGDSAAGHTTLSILLACGLSVATYALLAGLGMGRLHATVVAVLLLLFPWSDATRFWPTASLNQVAVVLAFGGLLAGMRGAGTGGRRAVLWHALALALYALALLTYEAVAGIVAASLLAYRTRTGWRPAAARWASDVLVAVVALAYLRSTGTRSTAGAGESLSHAAAIADQAATILAASVSPDSSTPRWLAGGLLLALVLAGALLAWRAPAGDPARRGARRWLLAGGAGAGVLVLAYLPFVPADPWYTPLQPGEGTRVNLVAALGYVLCAYAAVALAATLAARLAPGRRWVAPAVMALGAGGLALGFLDRLSVDRDNWARAAVVQDEVLGKVRAAVPSPARGTALLVAGFPSTVAPGVPVFFWEADLTGAVRVVYDDGSLGGYPMQPGMTLGCDADAIRPAGRHYGPEHATPYGAAILVDLRSGATLRITDPGTCRRAAAELGAIAG